MRFGIEQNKLIALDVLNGQGLMDFARNPVQYLERKYINVKSNGNKKEGQQLFDKMKKEKLVKSDVGEAADQQNDNAIAALSAASKKTGMKRQISSVGPASPPSPSVRPQKKLRKQVAHQKGDAEDSLVDMKISHSDGDDTEISPSWEFRPLPTDRSSPPLNTTNSASRPGRAGATDD
jgi:hypothetical protein